MTLSWTRRLILGSRPSLTSFFAVVALIVGLLAMHTLSSSGEHHGEMSAASAVADHHIADPMNAPAPAECDGACEAGHVMWMSCILALLAIGLLVVAANPTVQSLVGHLTSGLVSLASASARLFSPAPSLELLSISRT